MTDAPTDFECCARGGSCRPDPLAVLSPSSVAWIDEAMANAADGAQWMRERTTAATKALNDLPLYNFGLIDGYGRVIGNPERSAA